MLLQLYVIMGRLHLEKSGLEPIHAQRTESVEKFAMRFLKHLEVGYLIGIRIC